MKPIKEIFFCLKFVVQLIQNYCFGWENWHLERKDFKFFFRIFKFLLKMEWKWWIKSSYQGTLRESCQLSRQSFRKIRLFRFNLTKEKNRQDSIRVKSDRRNWKILHFIHMNPWDVWNMKTQTPSGCVGIFQRDCCMYLSNCRHFTVCPLHCTL